MIFMRVEKKFWQSICVLLFITVFFSSAFAAGNAQNNLNDTELVFTQENLTPFELKNQARSFLQELIPEAVEDDLDKLLQADSNVEASLKPEFWITQDLILDANVFVFEKKAGNFIRTLYNRESSNLDNNKLLFAISRLVQADQNISKNLIEVIEKVLPEIEDENVFLQASNHLQKAKESYDKAQHQLNIGNSPNSIEHFKNSWIEGFAGLSLLDEFTIPLVFISSPQTNIYTNQEMQTVSGTVWDVQLQTINSVVVQVNDSNYEFPLISGVYSGTVPLVDGNNLVTVFSTDRFGNTGKSESIEIVLDITPPKIEFLGVENNSYYNYDLNPEILIIDKHLSETQTTLNSAEFVSGSKVSNENEYILRATAKDLAGNESILEYKFAIDKTPPEVKIISPLHNSFLRQNISVSGTATDKYFNFLEWRIDGQAKTQNNSFNWNTLNEASDGLHEILLFAKDLAGNTNTTTIQVTVDNTLPKIFITGIEEGKFYNSNVLPLINVVELNPDTNTFLLNNQAYVLGEIISTEFEHLLLVSSTDKAGNTATKQVSFVIDKTPPSIEITYPLTGAFLRGVFDVLGSTYDLYLDLTKLFIDGLQISNHLPYQVDSTKYADGLHEIKYYANDKAGNENEKTTQVEFDNTPPKIENINPSTGSHLRQIVSVNANIIEKNLKQLQVFLDSNFLNSILPFNLNTTEFEDGSHELKITAEDKAGNTAEKSTQIIIDNTPPMLSINDSITDTTIEESEYLIIGETEPGIYVTLNNLTLNVDENGLFVFNSKFILGENQYKIIARDIAGNESTWEKTFLLDGDTLPEDYEKNVLLTNPLLKDSDFDGVSDADEDFDGDKLNNLEEFKGKTNPFNADSDGDGLNDYFEAFIQGTNPNQTSTDSISSDALIDLDGDGLTALQEFNFGTNPDTNDSDFDGITDYKEINELHSNPISKDSDGDGLNDEAEISFGTNILTNDSDNDGIPDGQEIFIQEIPTQSQDTKLIVTGKGDLRKKISIVEDPTDLPSTVDTTTLIKGAKFNIKGNNSFNEAEMRFYYTEEELKGLQSNELRLYYLDEEKMVFKPLEIQGINSTEKYVWGKTTHFSSYFLSNSNPYGKTWNGIIDFQNTYLSGNAIKIKANIRNNDTETANNVKVSFRRNNSTGTEISSTTISSIAGNSMRLTQITWYAEYGVERVCLVLDPDNVIAESSEFDNSACKSILIAPDSDGDGLTNNEESSGMRTGTFKYIYTDPQKYDSDGDGVSDGFEMGEVTILPIGGNYYALRSDPNKKDSDDDGLDDYHELKVYGTNAFKEDTDNDGLTDLEETTVTRTNPIKKDSDGDGVMDGTQYLSKQFGGTSFAVLNGSENNLLPDGTVSTIDVEILELEDNADKTFADLGFNIACEFAFGDWCRGEWTIWGLVDTLLSVGNVIAIIVPADGPLVDFGIASVKTVRVLDSAKKWYKLSKIANAVENLVKIAKKAKITFEVVTKGVKSTITRTFNKTQLKELKNLGILFERGAKKETIDALPNLLKHYGDDGVEAINRLKNTKNVPVKNMETVLEKGGDLKKTINVAEDSGKQIKWLEEGNQYKGWQHIKTKHVDSGDFAKIGLNDNEIIQSKIFESIKNPGKKLLGKTIDGKPPKECYLLKIGAKFMATIVGSDGSIITSYPPKYETYDNFQCK